MRGENGREVGKRVSGAVLNETGFARALSALRRIVGMPDYEAHLRHLREHHPGAPVPTRREFYESFIERRYREGPTRCC
jgi:uncharacterized short protein YbdD (DUF466 family)